MRTYLIALLCLIAFSCNGGDKNISIVATDIYYVTSSGSGTDTPNSLIGTLDEVAQAACGDKPYALRTLRYNTGCVSDTTTAWVYCGDAMLLHPKGKSK